MLPEKNIFTHWNNSILNVESSNVEVQIQKMKSEIFEFETYLILNLEHVFKKIIKLQVE